MLQILGIVLAVIGALVLGAIWLWDELSGWLEWIPWPRRRRQEEPDGRS